MTSIEELRADVSGNAYRERAHAVYWNKGTRACRAKGPQKATCLLDPKHEGDHYGNGYDEWGPKGAISWEARS